MSSNVLRLWLNSSVYETHSPFYLEGFRRLAEELGVEIELRTIPWSRAADSLISAFKNGNPPDVFQMGTTFIRTFAHLDYLMTVPPEIGLRPSLSGWVDACCTYKGVRVAVPWTTDIMIMAARQDILNRYGVKPGDVADMDGFYNVCAMLAEEGRKLKDNDRFLPVAFQIRPENKTLRSYAAWLFSNQWRFPSLSPIPESILEHDTVIKTFEYISRLIKASRVTIKDVSLHPHHLFEQFASQGRFAFSIEYWGGDISSIIRYPGRSAYKGADITVMPLPSPGGHTATWGGGSNLTVSSFTKYPEAAWKLVEYLCSDGFMDQWTSNSGDLPAFQSSFWESNSKDGYLGIMYDQIKRSASYPSHPLWIRIEKYLCNDIANLLWHMMNNRMANSEAGIRSALHKIDRRVIDTLMMAWEIDNEE